MSTSTTAAELQREPSADLADGANDADPVSTDRADGPDDADRADGPDDADRVVPPTTFTRFTRLPVELQNMIFKRATNAPHFHRLFVDVYDEYYNHLEDDPQPEREVYVDVLSLDYVFPTGSYLSRVASLAEPCRLPLSGDRLDIILSCKQGRQVVEHTVNRNPRIWRKIGEPEESPTLINTATDLAWIVQCARYVGEPDEDMVRDHAEDFVPISSRSWNLLYPSATIWNSNCVKFSGIKHVAMDFCPNPSDQKILNPGGHSWNDVFHLSIFPQASANRGGRDIFNAQRYLLQNFDDLEVVYLIDSEPGTYGFDPDAGEPGEEWSRYHLRGGPIDWPATFGTLVDEYPATFPDWSGVEDAASLASRPDDVFYGRAPKGETDWSRGHFTELRAPISFLKFIDKYIVLLRQQYLWDDVGEDHIPTELLENDEIKALRRKREAVEFKFLTWKAPGEN